MLIRPKINRPQHQEHNVHVSQFLRCARGLDDPSRRWRQSRRWLFQKTNFAGIFVQSCVFHCEAYTDVRLVDMLLYCNKSHIKIIFCWYGSVFWNKEQFGRALLVACITAFLQYLSSIGSELAPEIPDMFAMNALGVVVGVGGRVQNESRLGSLLGGCHSGSLYVQQMGRCVLTDFRVCHCDAGPSLGCK